MPYEHYGGVTVTVREASTGRWAAIRDEPTPEREALCEWLDFHGVPKSILDGAVITRDDVNHRITIEGWIPEDELHTAPIGPDGRIQTKTYVDQGEAGPLPFPSVIEFVDV